MINALITVLIYALIFGVLWWAFTSLIPLPEPFGRVAQVLIVLIFLLLILGVLFGHVPVFTNLRL